MDVWNRAEGKTEKHRNKNIKKVDCPNRFYFGKPIEALENGRIIALTKKRGHLEEMYRGLCQGRDQGWLEIKNYI